MSSFAANSSVKSCSLTTAEPNDELARFLASIAHKKQHTSSTRILVCGIILLISSVSLLALALHGLLPVLFSKDNLEPHSYSYYAALLPLTIPATLIWSITNWMGLKFFRHN